MHGSTVTPVHRQDWRKNDIKEKWGMGCGLPSPRRSRRRWGAAQAMFTRSLHNVTLLSAPGGSANGDRMLRSANELVTKFCALWSTSDVDAIVNSLAEDAVYHNIPMDPLRGREAIRAFIENFMTTLDGIQLEVTWQARPVRRATPAGSSGHAREAARADPKTSVRTHFRSRRPGSARKPAICRAVISPIRTAGPPR
jgi:uncharacterized protein (TIGR02246 family)